MKPKTKESCKNTWREKTGQIKRNKIKGTNKTNKTKKGTNKKEQKVLSSKMKGKRLWNNIFNVQEKIKSI